MGRKHKPRSLTPFDGGYHVHLTHNRTTFGNPGSTHKKTDSRDGFGDIRPWHRSLATCEDHICKVNRGMDVFDFIGGQLRYIGRSYSDRDAVSKWQAYLQTIGAHAENAVMLDA